MSTKSGRKMLKTKGALEASVHSNAKTNKRKKATIQGRPNGAKTKFTLFFNRIPTKGSMVTVNVGDETLRCLVQKVCRVRGVTLKVS